MQRKLLSIGKKESNGAIEGKELNKQGGSVWIWRGGGSFALIIPLGDNF